MSLMFYSLRSFTQPDLAKRLYAKTKGLQAVMQNKLSWFVNSLVDAKTSNQSSSDNLPRI